MPCALHQGSFASFWPPSGLYVAALLMTGTARWSALVLAGTVANISFDLLHGRPLLMTLGFSTANALEALLGAWLVRRFVSPRPTLGSVREMFGLAGLSGLVSTAVGASLGAATLAALGSAAGFAQNWLVWWSADLLGVLLVAPIVLTWSRRPGPEAVRRTLAVWLEFAAVCGIEAVVAFRTLGHRYVGGHFEAHLVTLPLIWAAMRFPLELTVLLQMIAVLAMVTTAKLGVGDFAYPAHDVLETVRSVQGFAAVTAFTILMLAAASNERRGQAARLRGLAARLSREHDREQRGLAVELRDQLAQVLFAAKLRLQLSETDGSADPQRLSREALGLLDSAISRTLALSHELSSTILQEIGLEAALRALVDDCRERLGLVCRLEISGEGEVGEEASDIAFRAAGELLNNVGQHSGAEEVVVALSRGPRTLRLVVGDRGVGFDVNARTASTQAQAGVGLDVVKASVLDAGGTFEIDSAEGAGTVVTVTLPLSDGLSAGG